MEVSIKQSIQEVLIQTSWVRELPAKFQERVYADAYEQIVEEGTIVAHKGTVADSWIGVAEGLLKISAVYRSGKLVMFAGISASGWVGEGSVIKREVRRYDIVALRNTRLIHLPAPTVHWLLKTSIEFNHIIIAMLNERLGQSIGMAEIHRLSDPVARVARSIGMFYNPILCPRMSPFLQFSQKELGELVGLSRQSVSGALKHLETKGLLSIGYGGVIVRKLSSLVGYQERD